MRAGCRRTSRIVRPRRRRLAAARRADPDTPFFERRVQVEGDTETGLLPKNIIDAVEVPRWPAGA